MICGDPPTFAIESGITKAYQRLGFRALGYFVIYISGYRYGVHQPDATMLACSFDEVENRIARRGTRVAPFANEPSAGEIADAFRDAIYAPDQEDRQFFGILQPEFSDFFSRLNQHTNWAPDGDEAFDDGSYVLHFDVGSRVRLIGFKSCAESYHHDPATLREIWLEADKFYDVLKQWRDAFNADWKAASKISEAEDGAET